MEWIILALAFFYTIYAFFNVVMANYGGIHSVISAGWEAFSLIAMIIMWGLSFYFWRSGLAPQMNLFFVLVMSFYSAKAIMQLFKMMGSDGEIHHSGPAALIFNAMINLSIAAGFWYVFYLAF